MNFDNLNTYSDSPENAFETFCTHLFERYLRRKYGNDLKKFRVVNGAGGDGGIEAYGELTNGDLIAVQAKWFRTSMGDAQINQIEGSVNTALKVRKNIKEYIICIPRSLSSTKMGKGGVPVTNTEEYRVDELTTKLQATHTGTKFTWWFEQDMQKELLEADNEGVRKFWFERETVTHHQLVRQFELEKATWIDKRYIPELHGPGIIQQHIEQILFTEAYRKTLLDNIKDTIKILQNATLLISKFTNTLETNSVILPELQTIQSAVDQNIAAFLPLINTIQEGLNALPKIETLPFKVNRELLSKLEDWKPTSLQLGLPMRLIHTLNRLADLNMSSLLSKVQSEVSQLGKLFIGDSGTGKTHAVSNTVDIRVNQQNVPALIIRAKGSPCDNWTSLLQKALDIPSWNKDELLSALEALAVRADYQAAKALYAGDELKKEPTKVMICVDGLEEDTTHWSEWYDRIRESMVLMNHYPRVRFAFTARPYFRNDTELPTVPTFQTVEVPREGDTPVQEAVDRYFEHFNIAVEPRTLIKGIDSLYALRLFCELYEGRNLIAGDEILTAEYDLLDKKIDQIEDEFRKVKNLGASRKPIREAVVAISNVFYRQTEISHNDLFEMLKTESLPYLSNEEIERIIDFLVNNAFLTKSEAIIESEVPKKTRTIYNLTYQSIMEVIMAHKYVNGIVKKEIDSIPKHLIAVSDEKNASDDQLVNQRIVQEIVNTLFHKHNLLIGRDGFLSEGVSSSTLNKLQLTALIQAPPAIASSFKATVDNLYYRDHQSRHFVFRNLIYPSAASAANYFGAEYLHGLLMQQATAVERDKLWLGMDRYDLHELGEDGRLQHDRYDLRHVIDPSDEGDLYLPELSLHNEYPLVFGWALSTLDQHFRERLRVALTGWAIKQPKEFVLLLTKLFPCNDPQIQEDLAVITSGVASKLKDKDALQELAEWALVNVFSQPERHRDIIVRTGFRSVIEKALYTGTISEEQAIQARPHARKPLQLIPVDTNALEKEGEEIYPIVHDLAWYVIRRSFDDFLEYGSVNLTTVPRNASETFLKAYLDQLNLNAISAHSWAISAAITYMKSLGFSRTSGNGSTQASHGSKSKLFTQEEKYTWLAVHYIQGYLSDYLPLKEAGEFVDDYMKIIGIDNPAELLPETISKKLPDEANWIIKEPLAPEMQDGGSPDEQINLAVTSEPTINFNNWVQFSDSDLHDESTNKHWLALFNYTSVHDSKSYISSSITIRSVLVEQGQALALLRLVTENPEQSHFVEYLDRLVSSPNTDTYSNPTDVVWMKWIGEYEDAIHYHISSTDEEKQMQFTIASVTRSTVSGSEEEVHIPSKVVRDLLEINEMAQHTFLDSSGQVVAVNHTLNSSDYKRQEMTLVVKEEFLAKLAVEEKELVWFVDLLHSKNPLNDSIRSKQHPMKTRKYMIWYENGQLKWEKFWDTRFSNQRDEGDRSTSKSDHDGNH